MVLEDTFAWSTPENDADYDDFYWTVGVKRVTFKFDKTYSDQIAGSDHNYLPEYTGSVKDYILMGTRSDGNIYTKSDLTIEGDVADFKQDVRFAYHNLGTENYSPPFPTATSSWSNDQVFINDGPPANQIGLAKEIEIVAGFDNDNDGQLQEHEIAATNPHKIRYVDEGSYSEALQDLAIIYNTTWAPFPHAPNFLYAFANNLGLSGATNSPSTVQSSDPRLSHHVGANFAVSGNVNKAVFSPSGPSLLPGKIVASPEVDALLNTTIDHNRDELIASAPPPGYDLLAGPFNVVNADDTPATAINFAGSTDLHYALGNAGLQDMTAVFRIHTRLRDDGTKELIVENATVTGKLVDLYDFQYASEDALAGPAAAAQAGYPTLGNGGHIYEIEVNLDNTTTIGRNLGTVA